ncbi:REP-associated tyrosine transposase [Alkalilimnicola sp. S0819]|uniref:REP-associated tyrosine transposase n=1 Tax=Alkalilimnicola sp. S0819 TaxID=2613922 RepID=UPI0012622E62|nr:transposase [Alkalilimnicola sp. S0819]KAB7622781.1 transposase [Alkalilimnicola sp. S0819]MPQ17277.1 transposase [Alkalilimnicola sp. S0819]
MVNYRHTRVPGGTYFFTLTLQDRRSDLLIREVALLRELISQVRQARPFHILAAVVMPEHLHMVWRLPVGDADYPERWRAIKAGFSRRLKLPGSPWQRRCWEHCIRNAHDLARHVDYIHYNPVKHGLVARAVDWRYSSMHRYIARGEMSADWGCAPVVMASGRFGD